MRLSDRTRDCDAENKTAKAPHKAGWMKTGAEEARVKAHKGHEYVGNNSE